MRSFAAKYPIRESREGRRNRLAILKKHLNHLGHVPPQFVQSLALAVGTWKTRNIAYVEMRVWALLYDKGKRLHLQAPYALEVFINTGQHTLYTLLRSTLCPPFFAFYALYAV